MATKQQATPEHATVTSVWRSFLNMLTLAITTTERTFHAADNAMETIEHHAVEMRNSTVSGDKRKTLAALR